MTAPADQPEEIAIEYEYDSDYRIIAVNGMFGGLTPRGDLRVDFFVEHAGPPGPGAVKYRRDSEGSFKEVPGPKSYPPKLTRRLQVGILIPPQHIESFSRWFKDKAEKIQLARDPSSEEVH